MKMRKMKTILKMTRKMKRMMKMMRKMNLVGLTLMLII